MNADEVILHSEARNCYSRSRAYNGKCFFRHHRTNCKALCKQEQFVAGRCRGGTCYCLKPCGTGGHHSHPPPPKDDGGDDTPAPPKDDGGSDEGKGEGGGEVISLKH